MFKDNNDDHRPAFMHPAAFLAAWLVLAVLFAFQEWVGARTWNYHVSLKLLITAWSAHYLLWGIICQVLWWRFRSAIQNANLRRILIRVVPLSLFIALLEEAIWVALFPHLPLRAKPMSYWHRLRYYIDTEILDNLVIFWIAFFFFRSIGYYQKFRERDRMAAQLESQLVNAQLRALRMQLNPHFLFNTMNSISSLMRSDVEAADEMLEQLSSMLRITLERSDAQMNSLGAEMESVHMYLSIQTERFRGRVHPSVKIEPEVLDALVPTMILQPILENAFSHGIARVEGLARLVISATKSGDMLRLSVLNSGIGLSKDIEIHTDRECVGIANVRGRLKLLYGTEQSFFLNEGANGEVEAIMLLPLRFANGQTESDTRYLYADTYSGSRR